jgi:hypothetical protein
MREEILRRERLGIEPCLLLKNGTNETKGDSTGKEAEDWEIQELLIKISRELEGLNLRGVRGRVLMWEQNTEAEKERGINSECMGNEKREKGVAVGVRRGKRGSK